MTLYDATIKARGGIASHVTVMARTLREAWAKAEEIAYRHHKGALVRSVRFAGFAHALA